MEIKEHSCKEMKGVEEFYKNDIYNSNGYWIVEQDMYDYEYTERVKFIKFCPFCGKEL